MDWAPQQLDALDAIQAWRSEPAGPQTFYLAGYAGTGKSTLAKHIGESETNRGGLSQYAALTGKAALVLKRKGCTNAKTIHSLIYTSHDKDHSRLDELEARLAQPEEANNHALKEAIADEKASLLRPGWSLKPKEKVIDNWLLDEEYGRTYCKRTSLFIIDECSMVDRKLGEDLMSFGIPILVLGDPAQLPPVAGAGYFTTREPDVLLTDVHRQALDNPIIGMATQVRAGKELALGSFGDSRVITAEQATREDWLNADQVLVGKNNTRLKFNSRFRQLRGFEGFLPMPGERLVCLRNNQDAGLLNGGLWECIETQDDPKGRCFNLHAKSIDNEGQTFTGMVLKAGFLGVEPPPFIDRDLENDFTFGYALTVHKAQGSEWKDVIYYDEWTWKGRREHVYTGITRAAERITVVRP